VVVELARGGENLDSALNRIQKEADRLNELVTGLMQVTRGEGDPSALRRQDVHLDELLKTLEEDCSIEARERGCRIELLSGVPVRIAGDPELLRRAFENVLRNAIRYAPPGTAVEAALALEASCAKVSIRDYGPGVPEESLPRLFDAFYRVEQDRGRLSGGAGLGLAIARRAVELHQGRIRARNAGPGLLVEIEIPAGEPAD
jgi:two-component system sensor histidine kinase CpxA